MSIVWDKQLGLTAWHLLKYNDEKKTELNEKNECGNNHKQSVWS